MTNAQPSNTPSTTQSDFPYYQQPNTIRSQTFSRRRRGFDPDEVGEYLDLLADQVKVTGAEHQGLREENEKLQKESAQLRSELTEVRARLEELEQSGDRVNDQVVELFSQAQLVAEEMVEDVSRDARQRLSQARAQERQILEEAMQAAERTRREAEALITQSMGPVVPGQTVRGDDGADVEQLRTAARAAQAQMQSIMDAFAHEVARLAAPESHDVWQLNGRRPTD